MTISILKLEAGQKIARPFSRASSVEEMREIIGNACAVDHPSVTAIKGWNLRAAKIEALTASLGLAVVASNLDTETPVWVEGKTKFYAFTEI